MEQLECSVERKADGGITPSPGVSLHFLQDEGVLFDSGHQALYAANTTAAFIWCCLSDRLGEDETARRFAATFGSTVSEARDHVARTIDHWRSLRLIDASGLDKPVTAPEAPPAQVISTQDRADTKGDTRDYILLDTRFRLRIPSRGLRRQACRLLAPLRAGDKPAFAAVLVELRSADGGYTVHANGKNLEQCDTRSQALPMLKACLLRLALQQSNDFAAIHAAAAARGRSCIVIPAASGGGKSTLAAGLVARGFRLLSDDTVVLGNDDLSVRPLPFSICLKKGAWKLLASRFPDLMDQPVHDRPDGKQVRYLAPPQITPHPTATDPARVSAIVFLNRGPKRETALVPLSATAALKRLLNGFHPLGGGLDDAKVNRLLRWVSATDAFELRFSSLDDGVRRLERICP